MMQNKVYDIIGVGIGPFNLGLAALAESIHELNCLFFDQQKEFNWHLGLLLDSARLQVPFYADLVTLADPCNRFSYMAFLKAKQRLFRFAIHEHNFVTRKEYNEYCKWVAGQLPNLMFGYKCESIKFEEASKLFHVFIRDNSSQIVTVFYCRYIVLGTGAVPYIPEFVLPLNFPPKEGDLKKPLIFHSSDYLYFKELLLNKKSVSIIGSGQSAAETFYDLLPHSQQFSDGLNWFTRSDRFFPMEYSKLSLEMTSPDYINHFFRLNPAKKSAILKRQDMLYKGINFSLINEIYDELFLQSLSNTNNNTRLCANTEFKGITEPGNGIIELTLFNSDVEKFCTLKTEALILATGYRYQIPEFIEPIKELIKWSFKNQYDVNLNYSIDHHNRIFVQNAELHTHGFNTPDLGMGPYRNAIILNTILGYDHYKTENNIAFQTFGIPS